MSSRQKYLHHPENIIHDLETRRFCLVEYNNTNGENCKIPNHEYMTGGFSTIYMSRNRVRSWDQQSFTIQVGGRHRSITSTSPQWNLLKKIIEFHSR
jgi:DNA (cytosine-5)-methyltransferase 1